ncbi:hypothetical protein [Synechococcus sp. CBW1107]|uniref:hypothetical protein n=1 Tax=Synechococcus sp. CBW1107 TaxID=2789857 RepID=UPI002AD44B9D|nr:hypothetical protein [Synechococcus sp. CBW1107]
MTSRLRSTVRAEILFCEAEALQLGLYQTAGLKESFPVVQVTLLGQGHVKDDRVALACHLKQ